MMEQIKEALAAKGIHPSTQQLAAAIHRDGPHLIMSCPGSGKTTTLVLKLYILVKHYHIDPRSILTMTFSKTGARDMERRFYAMFPDMPEKTVRFSTIHAFAYSVIKNYERQSGISYTLIEGDEAMPGTGAVASEGTGKGTSNGASLGTRTASGIATGNGRISKVPLLRSLYLSINKEYATEEQLETLMGGIGFVSNRMVPVKDFENYTFDVKNFTEIYCAYKDYKREHKLVDFDDMLTLAYSILQGTPKLLAQYRKQYRYICLDEGQDTSVIQFRIVKLLAAPTNNLCIIGDDDQTLYSWRGAEPRELLDFQKDYPGSKLYYMETNYRSPAELVDPAAKFIQLNRARYQKKMNASRASGGQLNFCEAKDERDYARRVIASIREGGGAFRDYAVLFRNNNSSVVLANEFTKQGVPFVMKDTKLFLFTHWVTMDLLAFLRLSLNPADVASFERIYYKMDLYLSKTALEYVQHNAAGGSVFQCLLKNEALSEQQKERLQRYEIRMQMVSRLVPENAIEQVMTTLQYDKFLNKSTESGSENSLDYLLSIADTLKTIAADCMTIPEFFFRLEELDWGMRNAGRKHGMDAVNFSTLHSSKGCEYETVFLSVNENELPSYASLNTDKTNAQQLLEEERRVFYVGITRAKSKVFLYTLKERNGRPAGVSQFYHALKRIVGIPEPTTRDASPGTWQTAKGVGRQTDSSRHSGSNRRASNGRYADVSVQSNADENFLLPKYNVDSIIEHRNYGQGAIVEIKRDKLAETCVIQFSKYGMKSIDLRFCLKKGIVSIVG